MASPLPTLVLAIEHGHVSFRYLPLNSSVPTEGFEVIGFSNRRTGTDGGIRTHTERVLSALPLPLGCVSVTNRGASGRSRTSTGLGLKQLPLLVGLRLRRVA